MSLATQYKYSLREGKIHMLLKDIRHKHDNNNSSSDNIKKGLLPIMTWVLLCVFMIICYTWILQRNYSKNTLESALERNIIRSDTINETVTKLLNDNHSAICIGLYNKIL